MNRICGKCNETVFDRTGVAGKHECGKKHCKSCNEKRDIGHPDCHLRPLKPAPENFPGKSIFFDFESTFIEIGDRRTQHVPNLCVALKCCRLCWHNMPSTIHDPVSACNVCGEERLMKFHSLDSDTNPVKEFLAWLSEEEQRDYTLIAHNLRAYDGQFLLRQILQTEDDEDTKYKDEPILAGNHIMTARFGLTKGVDSINFLPCALSSFTKQFELGERKKGFFPYKFNVKENYGYRGPLPPVEMYGLETLSKEKKEALVKWHAQKTSENYEFSFLDEIFEYCFSDVLLLAEGCVKFSEDFFKNAGVWPFHESLTAASAAMKCFRRSFLKPYTLPVDKPTCLKTRQSVLALKFFEFLRRTQGLQIQDAKNGGEKKIGPFFADGFINEGRGIVYEVKGCYHHMHNCRYTEDSEMRGTPALRIRARDAAREAFIRQHHDLKIFWECDIMQMIKDHKDMEKFFRTFIIYDSLAIPHTFFGGRTEAFKLRYRAEGNFKIMYLDYCSLYPFIQKYRKYPKGGMRVISRNELPRTISTVDELKATVQGFLMCRVLPPRDLHVPVLPVRAGKLLFALCPKCVEERSEAACAHSEEERTMTGSWATPELELALEKNYRIVECLQAIHYDEWTEYKRGDANTPIQHGTFSSYIDTHLKLKAQASGWPAGTVTDAQKQEYIQYFYREEGVLLEESKISKNGPARASSKLLLNSLWGKFAEKSKQIKSLVTSGFGEYHAIVTSPGTSISSFVMLEGADRIELKYKLDDDSIEPLATNSVAIASLTTAYARVHLYRALERIHPDHLLYCDTDSIIFAHDETLPNPLADLCGDTLGKMTDELEPGWKCVQYASQGPKVYALKMQKEEGGEIKESVKCRGFTMTENAQKVIDFERIDANACALVNRTEQPVKTVEYFKIISDRTHNVFSEYQVKTFQSVFDKRCIRPDSGTNPFGHNRPSE